MEEFAQEFRDSIEVIGIGKSLGLSFVFALVLGFVVSKFSRIIGDRSQYVIIFFLLMPTMVLIISVIKTSLALSLGLVGALSIVRFRTPIKEPEELAYLFIAIATGLGLGAGEYLVTTVSFIAIAITIVLLSLFYRSYDKWSGVYLEVECQHAEGDEAASSLSLSSFKSMLKEFGIKGRIKRYQLDDGGFYVICYLSSKDPSSIDDISKKLRDLYSDARIALIDRAQMNG